MALKTCAHCGRKFSAARQRCPDCRRRHHGDDTGPSRRIRFGAAAVVVLAVASVVYNTRRETGPPGDFEALHSPGAAIEECLRGVALELRDRVLEGGGALRAEHLGGGEYEVRGSVTLADAGGAATAAVLCEVVYEREGGWRVLDAEVGP